MQKVPNPLIITKLNINNLVLFFSEPKQSKNQPQNESIKTNVVQTKPPAGIFI